MKKQPRGYNFKKGEGPRFKIKKPELMKLYFKQRLSAMQIGKIYGLGHCTILRRLRDFGMKPTGQGVRGQNEYRTAWTEKEIKKLKSFYKSHPKPGDITKFAKELGKSSDAVILKAKKLELSKIWNIAKQGKKSTEMIEKKARKLFDGFKKSRYGIAMFSKMKGYSEVGLKKVFKKYFPDEYEFLLEEKRMRKDLWYKKGRRFEYRIRDYLKNRGYWVLRSPRSATSVDLVAIKKNSILMIQCKSGAAGISSKERKDILQICEQTGACPILAYRPSPMKVAFKKCLKEGYLEVVIS